MPVSVLRLRLAFSVLCLALKAWRLSGGAAARLPGGCRMAGNGRGGRRRLAAEGPAAEVTRNGDGDGSLGLAGRRYGRRATGRGGDELLRFFFSVAAAMGVRRRT